MDDYIKREAALSAQNKSMNLAEMRERLKRIPAADVVEVVRCKDCKHTKDDGCGAIYCKIWDRWEMPEDCFCANGKRKSDG